MTLQRSQGDGGVPCYEDVAVNNLCNDNFNGDGYNFMAVMMQSTNECLFWQWMDNSDNK